MKGDSRENTTEESDRENSSSAASMQIFFEKIFKKYLGDWKVPNIAIDYFKCTEWVIFLWK